MTAIHRSMRFAPVRGALFVLHRDGFGRILRDQVLRRLKLGLVIGIR
jgi:hypothetical protein